MNTDNKAYNLSPKTVLLPDTANLYEVINWRKGNSPIVTCNVSNDSIDLRVLRPIDAKALIKKGFQYLKAKEVKESPQPVQESASEKPVRAKKTTSKES